MSPTSMVIHLPASNSVDEWGLKEAFKILKFMHETVCGRTMFGHKHSRAARAQS